ILEHTGMVEDWLAQRRPEPLRPAAALPVAEVAPVLASLRGALASCLPEGAALPVLDLRAGEVERAFCARPDLDDLASRGVATPHHVIRTKGWPLVVHADARAPEAMRAGVAAFADHYRRYFATHA